MCRLAAAVRLARLLLTTFLAAAACSTAQAQTLSLEPVQPGLELPIGVTHAGDASGRLFISQQRGKVLVRTPAGTLLPTPFLDISGLVSCCGERGLLGLAFHPQYTANGWVFVSYTDLSGNSVVARYRVLAADPNRLDPASATTVLTVAQPFSNHNGGQIRFGPDGYLYVAMGDGGDAGDPGNRAQNLGLLLGKMLRIDVNTLPYAIPPSNPFAATAGARPEIWAYGLRNVWSFSFDRATGDLYMGDVGQGSWEEVDHQPAGSAGGQNYGWRRMEGAHCFNPSSGCDTGGLTLPVLEYDHSLGCSITGGFVYRGSVSASLIGTYLYGDYCSGRIWGAKKNGSSWSAQQLLDTSLSIVAFGEDEAGEVYVAHRGSESAANGALYRVRAAATGEIVIDNANPGIADAQRSFVGSWCVSGVAGQYGPNALYSCGGSADRYRWTPDIPSDGAYDVLVRWTANANRSASVPISVRHSAGTATRAFNQRTGGGAWVLHGRYNFLAGTSNYVEVSDANGLAVADAVSFVPAAGPALATLRVGVSGSGGGRVTSNPAGIDCGSSSGNDCDQDYAVDTVVRLTATPNPGASFVEWGGPCSGNGECVITMNDSKFLAATFRGAEVVVDNAAAGVQDAAGGRTFTGTWCRSGVAGALGADSLYSCGSGADSYRWTPTVPAAGGYDVYVRWAAHPNRSASAPITVVHGGGATTRRFNQQANGGQWVLHGRYTFAAGTAGYVQINDSGGLASADAVRLVPAF
jgi:glucose/arabinose dehydrogenase